MTGGPEVDGRPLYRIAIDHLDGEQTMLEADDVCYTPGGERVTAREAVAILSRPGGFVDVDSSTRFLEDDAEPEEPWQTEEEGPLHQATLRIFAQGVSRIQVIWDVLVPADA